MRFRRPAAVAVCLAASLGAGAAHAQFRLAPDWAETPDPERLSRSYPPVALNLALQGKVFLHCRVAIPTGVLQRCSVAEETPKGVGFGEAALAMSRDFQMRPPLAPGDPDPDDTVRIPITFKLPEVPKPAPLEPDPARLALALRVVDALGTTEALKRRTEADIGQMTALPQRGVEKGTLDAVATALRGGAPQLLAGWRQGMAGVLATRMSARQLAAVVGFAETPQGEAYLSSLVRLASDRQAVNREAQRRARAATREAFCARAACETKPSGEAPGWSDDDPPEPIIVWDRRPTPDELHRAWPLARSMALTGVVATDCVMGVQGTPEECRVVAESPAGLGAGAAALSLSDRYRLPTAQLASGMVGRKVLVMTAFLDPAPRGSTSTYHAPAVTPARRELARRLLEVFTAHWNEPGWRDALRAETETMSVLPGEVRQTAVAALATGYQVGDRTFRELSADRMAAELDEPTLRAAISFETGDGAALWRTLAGAEEELGRLSRFLHARLADDARAEFCRSFDCGPAELQPSADSSAPSTRTP